MDERISNQIVNTIDKKYLNDENLIMFISSQGYKNFLKSSQNQIIEIDKQYVQKFVKIGGYLKSTESNILQIFEKIISNTYSEEKFIDLSNFIDKGFLSPIKVIPHIQKITGLDFKEVKNLITKEKFEIIRNSGLTLEYIQEDCTSILKSLNNHIKSFEYLLISSVKMINSIKKNDLVTFYEIYEVFDNLGIFDSSWEKRMISKLSNINSSLDEINDELKNVNNTIFQGLSNLSTELKSVGENITEGLSKLELEVSDGLQSLESRFSNEFSSLKSEVSDGLKSLESEMSEGFNSLDHTLSDGFFDITYYLRDK